MTTLAANTFMPRDFGFRPPSRVMSGESEIDFDGGQVLMRLADTYPRLHDFILETIQNSIDSGANRIRTRIDLEHRTLDNADNGEGVSMEQFNEVLALICRSRKPAGKYGRFGLGMVSPLGKCESFTFTSKVADPAEPYIQWTFNTKQVTKMVKVKIPFEVRPDLGWDEDPDEANRLNKTASRGKPRQTFVWWRTQVKVRGLVMDRQISTLNIDDLVHDISVKFGEAIRDRKIDLTVRYTDPEGNTSVERQVVASEFTGGPLEPFTDKKAASGKTTFNLFLARNTSRGRQGEVLFAVEGDPYNLSTSQFLKCIKPLGVEREEAIQALTSGIFEGRVTCEKVTLNPDRKRFDANDALLDLCTSIVIWYEQIGRKHADEVRSKEKETRWQMLGLRSIKFVKALLLRPEYADILARFKIGNIGVGHKKIRGTGEQEETALALQGGVSEARDPSGEPGPKRDRPADPKKEKEGHHPVTVAGPRGQTRIAVKDSSTGLQFRYVEFESTLVPFEFSSKTGVLDFNVRHPFWSECSELDTSLMRYQEVVVQMALALVRFEESAYYENQRAIVMDLLKMQVFAIINADSLTGRRRAKS